MAKKTTNKRYYRKKGKWVVTPGRYQIQYKNNWYDLDNSKGKFKTWKTQKFEFIQIKSKSCPDQLQCTWFKSKSKDDGYWYSVNFKLREKIKKKYYSEASKQFASSHFDFDAATQQRISCKYFKKKK